MKVVREKTHRLSPAAYCGRVVVAFTINTAHRQPFFNEGGIRDIAAGSLSEAFAQHGGHCAVYVFMPDHLHLIVSGADHTSDLLALVSGFKQKTTHRVRKQVPSFAWQKDFYDHIIRAKEDYGAQVRYILRNPVRRGLVEHWEHWPNRGVLGQTWEQLTVNIGTL